MSGRSPGGSRCWLILQRCLAIQLRRTSAQLGAPGPPPPGAHGQHDYWMYDSGYLLFQGFLEANLKCFWNSSLLEAMRLLEFQGYVAPGVLLVTASACALEVVRAAWARNVLKAPNNYVIALVGDIEDCLVQPLPQGQFTPLPEALCWVILDLTSSGQAAVLERIRAALHLAFPSIQKPSAEIVYDALAKLMADRKVYQTAQGYFVVTPEKRRRERRPSRGAEETRPMLMSTEEALAYVHGEMATIRDGDVTHQAVQTNLADVICGGNPNDKILYPRVKRPAGYRLERRHSLRLFGSSKRLANSLNRCGSLRHLPNKSSLSTSDSSSSTDTPIPKKADKGSLLSRLFRRSGRKRGTSAPPAPLSTFSAQFPPTEWFNPRVVHLHSIGTQTSTASNSLTPSQGSLPGWTDEEVSSRAVTLPRRHRRQPSGDSASSLATAAHSSVTPRSSRRHRSPSSRCSSLAHQSPSRSTSRASVLPQSHQSPCKSSATTLSSLPQQSNTVSQTSINTPIKQGNSGVSNTPSKSNTPSPSKIAMAKHSTNSDSNKSSPSRIPVNSASSKSSGRSSTHSSPSKNSPAKQLMSVNGHQHKNEPGNMTSGGKSSITLQVSTSNRSSPPSSSGYSSQCQSSNGRSSVLSTASSVPLQEPIRARNVANISSSPNHYTDGTTSTTTTTTINGTNTTKIYVQQQNSPVRSVITLENGINTSLNGCGLPTKDIIIINGGDNSELCKSKGNETLAKCQDILEKPKSKIERPTSLYSPREVVKSAKMESLLAGNGAERKKYSSVESLNCSDISSIADSSCRNKITNCNYNNAKIVDSLTSLTNTNPMSRKNSTDLTNNSSIHHPNAQPPSTQQTSSDSTMNNTRILPSFSTSPALPAKNKESLSYKNIFRNNSIGAGDGISALIRQGSKNNFCSNPSSPTKSFDSFGGSYGNLYIENSEGHKLSNNHQDLFSSMKTLEEQGLKRQNSGLVQVRSSSDLCPYPSLSDLTVHFKSIAAQKILKGVSINSIDTLVEVNMAAAEKQNNCDVTIHTDFGMV